LRCNNMLPRPSWPLRSLFLASHSRARAYGMVSSFLT
jgi:hypothetical protein